MLSALILLLALPASAGVFPYPVHKKTLANGLDVLVVETPEYKNVLSYNTLVLAGARHEIEPGKTGLAHLFEHILFRHELAGSAKPYDEAIDDLGAHNNAWTWFDVTFYHPLTFAENLDSKPGKPGLAALEAERFKSLSFTEKIYKTESGAVLGEFRRNASQPSFKMSEELFAARFGAAGYGHTTMGTYEDVLDMPNEFAAAKKFYDDYYRPGNCVVLVVGDVRADEVFAKIEAAYGDWKAGGSGPQPKTAPAAVGPLARHVAWDADVAPSVWVSYDMPAFDPATTEGAVGQLLGELLITQAAPLYKRLRYEKQSVSDLGFAEGKRGYESADPRILTVAAELYKERFAKDGQAYFDEVAGDVAAGVEALKDFSKDPKAGELLAVLKSKYRYDFLAHLESPAAVAEQMAWYYKFGRDPAVMDKLLAAVERLEPGDIDRFARSWFTPEHKIVVTMAFKGGAK